jgi:fumarate hydratase class II
VSAVTRLESDSFGPIAVPAGALWGAQTQRSLEHFAISTERMPRELVMALAQVKRACALANAELAGLGSATAMAIAQAAGEVLAGRTSELLGGGRGAERLVHPNDDVNRGQSSNDIFPTALHVAAAEALARDLFPALRAGRVAVARERARQLDHAGKGQPHPM